MTLEELCVVVSTQVKEHFKKTIAEKEAPLGSSTKTFFVKTSYKLNKQPITHYKRMMSKAQKIYEEKCANPTVHMDISAWYASSQARRSQKIDNANTQIP